MRTCKVSRIDKIEKCYEFRYDIEVKNTHNFFANGILVHNSNFSIWYDGETIRAAKRSQFIQDDDGFNNWKKVVGELEDNVKNLWKELDDEYHDETEDNVEIAIFGEIFGGSYPHPDVEKVKGATMIQKGVYYTPDNLFYGFDIKVNGRYLDTKTVEELFERYDFFYAKPLFRGTFEECMNYPNDEQSRIPGWLGLPTIDDNICEGVVLRPVEPKFFACGSRAILKNKNERWAEKAKKQKTIKKETVLSENAELIVEDLSLYFTENRLRNVLSKIGQVTNKDFGLIMRDFQADAYKDFNKDHEDDDRYNVDALDKDEQKIVHKRACAIGAGLIRGNFQNIIDGTF
jgi:Rnl2 family RNA ligase